jgi:hypothetical protein
VTYFKKWADVANIIGKDRSHKVLKADIKQKETAKTSNPSWTDRQKTLVTELMSILEKFL